MREKEIPRIGPKLNEGEKLFHQFMDHFQEMLEVCVKTGRESKLMLGVGKRSVIVHIHEAGKESQTFDDVLKEVAKGNFEVRDSSGKILREGPKVSPTELEPT